MLIKNSLRQIPEENLLRHNTEGKLLETNNMRKLFWDKIQSNILIETNQ